MQTHDPKTGEVLRREGDDESATVMDLVRQERLQGGSRTDKDPDAEMAAHILGDRRFEVSRTASSFAPGSDVHTTERSRLYRRQRRAALSEEDQDGRGETALRSER